MSQYDGRCDAEMPGKPGCLCSLRIHGGHLHQRGRWIWSEYNTTPMIKPKGFVLVTKETS